jgi:hypothetical protein
MIRIFGDTADQHPSKKFVKSGHYLIRFSYNGSIKTDFTKLKWFNFPSFVTHTRVYADKCYKKTKKFLLSTRTSIGI